MEQTTFHPYPVWIGASIAILLAGGGFSTLAVALQRAFGRTGVALLGATMAGLFLWIFLSDSAPPSDPAGRFSRWAALGTCLLAFAIVPTTFLLLFKRGEASLRFWRQVGFTFLTVVGTLVVIVVLASAVGLVVHLYRS